MPASPPNEASEEQAMTDILGISKPLVKFEGLLETYLVRI